MFDAILTVLIMSMILGVTIVLSLFVLTLVSLVMVLTFVMSSFSFIAILLIIIHVLMREETRKFLSQLDVTSFSSSIGGFIGNLDISFKGIISQMYPSVNKIPNIKEQLYLAAKPENIMSSVKSAYTYAFHRVTLQYFRSSE